MNGALYAFRFATTEAQDDALIAQMNAGPNRSRFNLLVGLLRRFYRWHHERLFPGTFRRSILPDGGITTEADFVQAGAASTS
jgi:hypothetical protein